MLSTNNNEQAYQHQEACHIPPLSHSQSARFGLGPDREGPGVIFFMYLCDLLSRNELVGLESGLGMGSCTPLT